MDIKNWCAEIRLHGLPHHEIQYFSSYPDNKGMIVGVMYHT